MNDIKQRHIDINIEQLFDDFKVTDKERKALILHLSTIRTAELLRKYCEQE